MQIKNVTGLTLIVLMPEFVTNLSTIISSNAEHFDHLCKETALKLVSHWPSQI